MEVFVVIGGVLLAVLAFDFVRHRFGSRRGDQSIDQEVGKSQNHTDGHERTDYFG